LTLAGNGLSGTYTTLGNEFATAGLYDAALKVYNGTSVLLYSANVVGGVYVYPVYA